jgi:hypothetical protein
MHDLPGALDRVSVADPFAVAVDPEHGGSAW